MYNKIEIPDIFSSDQLFCCWASTLSLCLQEKTKFLNVSNPEKVCGITQCLLQGKIVTFQHPPRQKIAENGLN